MFVFKAVSEDTLNDPRFQKIINLLNNLELLAIKYYNLDMKSLKYKVKFDISSVNTLGLFKASRKKKLSLHFNEYLFKNSSFKDFKEIIIHEFAHLITYVVFGKQIDAHGPKWISVMKNFNAMNISAKTNAFKLVKKKPSDCFAGCSCSEYYISAHRATKIKNGVKYTCRKCFSILCLK